MTTVPVELGLPTLEEIERLVTEFVNASPVETVVAMCGDDPNDYDHSPEFVERLRQSARNLHLLSVETGSAEPSQSRMKNLRATRNFHGRVHTLTMKVDDDWNATEVKKHLEVTPTVIRLEEIVDPLKKHEARVSPKSQRRATGQQDAKLF
jgi:hypothetical protein